MKKAAGIFCICISLLGQTEMHQLFKLPFLISHYQEHNATGRKGFISFFSAHYIQSPEKKELPDAQHHQLPFRSAESNTHPDSIFLLKKHDFPVVEPVTSVQTYCCFNEIIPSIAGKGIFHPPRS